MDFGETNKLYINDNLSPVFKSLAYNCRLLKRENLITDTWYKNGYLKVKTLNGIVKVISHEIDIFKLSRDFNGFSFNTELYETIIDDEEDVARYDNLDGAHL